MDSFPLAAWDLEGETDRQRSCNHKHDGMTRFNIVIAIHWSGSKQDDTTFTTEPTPYHSPQMYAHMKRTREHSPPPLDGQPASVEDELVEGLLGGRLCSLPRGELDEGTLLPLDDGDGADLTKLVEMVPAEDIAKW